ncbi:MAG: TraB/GumN family protein [Gammaproteobacteria bacterium]
MKTLQLGDTQCVLLGTAHVSRQSAAQVKEEIASGNYDAVAVELCQNRYDNMQNPEQFSNTDLWQIIRQGKTGMMMANLALGAYQKRLADDLDIEPGLDMKTAIKDANTANLQLLLIDRNIGITLKRVFKSLSLWHALEMFSGLLNSVLSKEKVSEETIDKLKQGDMLESALTEFANKSPDLYTPLIDERDRYMAARLQQLITATKPERVLAVVGAAHVEGISRYMDEDPASAEKTLQTLSEVKQGFSWLKILPWILVVLILLGFATGFARSPELGLTMITDWVLLNGGLSGLGAILAGAHPLTILAAIVAAPITSLNPMLGAGMVCGLVEAALRKPRVADFVKLREDTTSLKGWWKNQVTRTLLVFAFTSIGSAIGTWLGGAMILGRLS